MRKRNKLFTLFVLLITAMLLLSSCTANALETAKKKKNTAAPQATAVVETPTAVPEPTATPGPATPTYTPTSPSRTRSRPLMGVGCPSTDASCSRPK